MVVVDVGVTVVVVVGVTVVVAIGQPLYELCHPAGTSHGVGNALQLPVIGSVA